MLLFSVAGRFFLLIRELVVHTHFIIVMTRGFILIIAFCSPFTLCFYPSFSLSSFELNLLPILSFLLLVWKS